MIVLEMEFQQLRSPFGVSQDASCGGTGGGTTASAGGGSAPRGSAPLRPAASLLMTALSSAQ